MLTSAPPRPTPHTSDPEPTRRRRHRRTVLLLLLGLLVASVAAAGLVEPAAQPRSAATPKIVNDRLAASIERAQDRLRRVPDDPTTWAALGTGYVEQARVSGNPAYYPQAQGALERSVQLQPEGNAPALIGLGALANARHDFAAARRYAEQAVATNPSSAEAYGVLADAATQLGDPAAATAAVQRMLDLRPGVAVVHQGVLRAGAARPHGRGQGGPGAGAWSPRPAATSRRSATTTSASWPGAAASWTPPPRPTHARPGRGPGDPALLHGQAKVLAARGQVDEAITGYEELTQRVPSAAVPTGVRRAAGVGRPERLGAGAVRPDRGAAPARRRRRARPTTWPPRCSPPITATLPRRSGWRWRSGTGGRACSPPTGWPGRCTRPAETPRRCRTRSVPASSAPADAVADYHRGMILAALGRTDEAIVALDDRTAAPTRTSRRCTPSKAGQPSTRCEPGDEALVVAAACAVRAGGAGRRRHGSAADRQPPTAHPLGNFTVNHYDGLRLFPDRVELLAVVDYAGDPDPAAASGRGHRRRRRGIGGRGAAARRPTSVVRSPAPSSPRWTAPRWTGGCSARRWRCSRARPGWPPRASSASCAPRPTLDRPATVEVVDGYLADRIGWREISAAGDGVRLLESTVPAASVTEELRAYPDDLLTEPLDVRSATLRVEPGSGGGGVGPAAAPGAGPLDRLLAELDGSLTRLIGSAELTGWVGVLGVLLAIVLGASHALLPGSRQDGDGGLPRRQAGHPAGRAAGRRDRHRHAHRRGAGARAGGQRLGGVRAGRRAALARGGQRAAGGGGRRGAAGVGAPGQTDPARRTSPGGAGARRRGSRAQLPRHRRARA